MRIQPRSFSFRTGKTFSLNINKQTHFFFVHNFYFQYSYQIKLYIQISFKYFVAFVYLHVTNEGYAHSAISPLMYWILNHNTLKQSPCSPFTRFASAQRFLRTNLRGKRAPPPPSSTNEAALGAFNPRYIKTRPQQYKAPASSHYLY